ncbi:MAG TPA: ATP-binding protein, partial [Minicystis sp.]|nr:ATP-binding protein [Minicystis sp.]
GDAALAAAPIEVVLRGASVSVEDAGEGVPSHIASRLGEPFLTTKEPGEGMGLGLFLVRAMVEQVGGRPEVAPRAPRGTRVTLHLAAGGAPR